MTTTTAPKRLTSRHVSRKHGVFVQQNRVGWYALEAGDTVAVGDTLKQLDDALTARAGTHRAAQL